MEGGVDVGVSGVVFFFFLSFFLPNSAVLLAAVYLVCAQLRRGKWL